MGGSLSPVVILLGLGMIAGGMLPVWFWQRGRQPLSRWFLYGALTWALGALLSLLVFTLFKETVFTLANLLLAGRWRSLVLWAFPASVQALLFWSAARLLADRLQWGEVDRDRAVALGLGSAAGAAGLTGLLHLLLSGVLMGVYSRLPEEMRRFTSAVLADSPGLVAVTILDKLLAAVMQVFVMLLILLGRGRRQFRWDAGALAYLAGFGTLAAWASDRLGVRSGGFPEAAAMEGVVSLFALGALAGARMLFPQFPPPQPPEEPEPASEARRRNRRIMVRPEGMEPARPAAEGDWPQVRRGSGGPLWPAWSDEDAPAAEPAGDAPAEQPVPAAASASTVSTAPATPPWPEVRRRPSAPAWPMWTDEDAEEAKPVEEATPAGQEP